MAKSNQSWKVADAKGQAFLFSFPYFILTEAHPTCPILEGEKNDAKVRLYPLFKSASNTFTGTPEVDPKRVPFTRRVQTNTERLFGARFLPTYDIKNADGKAISLFHADSMRIDVVADISEGELQRIAEELANLFTRAIRVICSQWWIGHPYAVFSGELRHVFSIDADGMPLSDTYGTGKVRTFGGFEIPVNALHFSNAFQASVRGITPMIADELLLDGILEDAKGNPRKSIMEFAVAMEIQRDELMSGLWPSADVKGGFRRGKACTGHDLSKHLDYDCERLFGFSLKSDNPELWENLRDFWQFRNRVAHGDLASVGDLKKSLEPLGDLRTLATDVVRWMKSKAEST